MAKAKKQAIKVVVEETAKPVKKVAPRVRAAKHRTAAAAAVNPPEEAQPILPEAAHAIVAAKAYSYWESRGCQGGDALEDWFRAENELRQQAMSATA